MLQTYTVCHFPSIIISIEARMVSLRRGCMNILQSVKNMMAYLTEAAGRMFVISDDTYPSVGTQPFEGTPNKDPRQKH